MQPELIVYPEITTFFRKEKALCRRRRIIKVISWIVIRLRALHIYEAIFHSAGILALAILQCLFVRTSA